MKSNNNNNNNNGQSSSEKPSKPHFRPAQDDTKPVLQDPVLSLSLSLSLSLNFYVNIWPVVVSIDMRFLYFVFFDIIILCVCGTIHFVIHQYRKFSIFVEAFGDVSLSSKTNYSLFKFFIWFFHFMFFDISLCVSSSIHFLFFDNCCKCERVI